MPALTPGPTTDATPAKLFERAHDFGDEQFARALVRSLAADHVFQIETLHPADGADDGDRIALAQHPGFNEFVHCRLYLHFGESDGRS